MFKFLGWISPTQAPDVASPIRVPEIISGHHVLGEGKMGVGGWPPGNVRCVFREIIKNVYPRHIALLFKTFSSEKASLARNAAPKHIGFLFRTCLSPKKQPLGTLSRTHLLIPGNAFSKKINMLGYVMYFPNPNVPARNAAGSTLAFVWDMLFPDQKKSG